MIDDSIVNCDFYLQDEFSRAQAIIDLILLAEKADRVIERRGVKLNVRAGQTVVSFSELSKRWKWSKSRVSRFFKSLERETQIDTVIDTANSRVATLITINLKCNKSKERNENRHSERNSEKGERLLKRKENDPIDYKGLLDYINTKTNRTGQKQFRVINNNIKAKYKARIKEGYTKRDILAAIDNAVVSRNHVENNFKYLTPEFFSRPDKIDMYAFTDQLKAKDKFKQHIQSDSFDPKKHNGKIKQEDYEKLKGEQYNKWRDYYAESLMAKPIWVNSIANKCNLKRTENGKIPVLRRAVLEFLGMRNEGPAIDKDGNVIIPFNDTQHFLNDFQNYMIKNYER